MTNNKYDWSGACSFEEVIERYGEWTAMSIHLGDGQYTLMPPRVDYRLRRLVQIATDLICKPLEQVKVLDLACLEGHYGLEFAHHGAEVVGIEGRDIHLAKAQFVKHYLKLNKFNLYQDDVRNLSQEKYGTFDIVLCSGILYHLEAQDVFQFIKNIYDVCDHIVLFDTFISLKDREYVEFEGKKYWGLQYREHSPNATKEDKKQNLWNSLDNISSFWLTQTSLYNLLTDIGFTSCYECYVPTMPNKMIDRKTYVAIKGKPVKIMSSPMTDQAPYAEIPEHEPIKFHPVQKQRSFLFRFIKKTFPQPVKNIIKSVLRTIRLMEPDSTPKHLKKK